MKRFSVSCLILSAITLMSCDVQPSQKPKAFNQDGVSFQHPDDWSTDDAEKTDSTAVSVTCQKAGLDESGMIHISCFSDSIELSNVQRIYHDQLDSTSLYRMAGVKFSPAQPGQFGQHESLQSQFTMSILGVRHTGWLDAFYYKGRTFMVLRQQADEDSAKNRSGFALIAKTLDVKQEK